MPRSTQTRNELMRLGGLLLRMAKAGHPAALEVLSHDQRGGTQGGAPGGAPSPRRGGTPDSVTRALSIRRGGTPGGHPSGRSESVVSEFSVGERTNGRRTKASVVRAVVGENVVGTQSGLWEGARPKRIRRPGFPELAVGIWATTFGAIHPGRMGKALKPAVEQAEAEGPGEGERIVLLALRAYCEDREHEAEHSSPEHFVGRWRTWAKRVPREEVVEAVATMREEGERAKARRRDEEDELWERAKRGDLDAET